MWLDALKKDTNVKKKDFIYAYSVFLDLLIIITFWVFENIFLMII